MKFGVYRRYGQSMNYFKKMKLFVLKKIEMA